MNNVSTINFNLIVIIKKQFEWMNYYFNLRFSSHKGSVEPNLKIATRILTCQFHSKNYSKHEKKRC